MAFLSNAKRVLTFSPMTLIEKEDNDNSKVGPGDYTLDHTDILKRLSQTVHSIIPSFNSTTNKSTNDNYLKLCKNSIPGPGYYNTLSSYSNNVGNNQRDTSIGFLVKDKRFREFEKIGPGPGEYYRKERNFTIKKKILQPKERTICREGEIKGKIKERGIGPGEYDVPMSWMKNTIDWNRMSSKEAQEDKDKQKEDENAQNEKIELNNQSETLFKKKYTKLKESIFNQIWKNRNIKFEEINKLESKKLLEQKALKTSQSPNRNPAIDFAKERYYHFGSTTPRFSISKEDSYPGPGSYHIAEVRKSPTHKINCNSHKVKKTFKTLPEIKGMIITSEGPCNERKIQTMNNTNNINDYSNGRSNYKEQRFFGRSEIRFKDNTIKLREIPGPGSYIHDLNLIKPQSEKETQKFNNKTLNENNQIKEQVMILQKENYPTPSVGDYNQTHNTIQGDLERINKIGRHSFMKGPQHIEIVNKNNDTNLGPGCYYNENEKKKCSNCKSFTFTGSRSSNRNSKYIIKSQLRYEHAMGPGMYNLNSYFDWNKKSFNIQYT